MISNTHPDYRADIDGLRAIAVLAVIAFHASARLVPGGFVGVDVFFVISGYLIARLIFQGLESGTFRFSDFYKGRIKRILPAYIAVALFTLAWSTYLLIPNDYIFYTTSLAASWGFASNIFFSMLSWGYFGQRTEEFPLLHTWSLSVEEQFYFLFPVLLIVLHRYCKTRITPILVLLAMLLAGWSEFKIAEVKSYFLLANRAHELLIGVITFFIAQRYPIQSTRLANVLAIIGAALLAGSLTWITRGAAFPGINSLYPCMASALLLYSCRIDNVLTPILKNRALVFIGLISYSLYLWHWPIFSFLRYRRIDLTFWIGTLAVAASFALAVLTWKFIERPVRYNKKIDFKQAFLLIYLLPTVAFMAVGAYSYFTEGVPQRFPEEVRQLISSYSFERDLTRTCAIRNGDYHKITVHYLTDHCAYGDLTQARPQILLFGDSHAHHFKPFVEYLAMDANLKAVYHVQGSCSPLDLPDAASGAGSPASVCAKRNADLLQTASDFKFVVIAGSWDYKGKEAAFENNLATVIEKIERAGATPVVFKDNPYHEPDLSQCVLFKKRGWIAADKNCNIPYAYVEDTQGSMNAVIDKIKFRYPQLVVIEPQLVMCNASECTTSIANTALYKDANHLNAKAARMLAMNYVGVKGNPFLKQTDMIAKVRNPVPDSR